MKKYYLKNKKYGMYFKSRWYKGIFHYVANIFDAKKLKQTEAIKLLKELKHPEDYEIIEKEIKKETKKLKKEK